VRRLLVGGRNKLTSTSLAADDDGKSGRSRLQSMM
jgi:hypothetical protein